MPDLPYTASVTDTSGRVPPIYEVERAFPGAELDDHANGIWLIPLDEDHRKVLEAGGWLEFTVPATPDHRTLIVNIELP